MYLTFVFLEKLFKLNTGPYLQIVASHISFANYHTGWLFFGNYTSYQIIFHGLLEFKLKILVEIDKFVNSFAQSCLHIVFNALLSFGLSPV